MPKRKQTQASLSPSSPPKKPAKARRGTRHSTVYDAVASRVNYEGFVHSRLNRDAYGRNYLRSQKAMPADEVLGRRRNAPEEPIPYGETSKTLGLPDSDLLIAIHQYAADFYDANGMGAVSYRSLDETALLAVGMLLEETVRTCLGENGDLVLIEQESDEGGEGGEGEDRGAGATKRRPVKQDKISKNRIPKYGRVGDQEDDDDR